VDSKLVDLWPFEARRAPGCVEVRSHGGPWRRVTPVREDLAAVLADLDETVGGDT